VLINSLTALRLKSGSNADVSGKDTGIGTGLIAMNRFTAVKVALRVVAALVVSAVAAHAEDYGNQKVIGVPGGFWSIWGGAKARFVAAAEIKGGVAQRVLVTPKPQNPWDAGTYSPITKPVKQGDVVVLMFYARLEAAAGNSDLALVTGSVYEAGAGAAALIDETKFVIGRQWKLYAAKGVAGRDYPPGTLSAGMKIATAEQTIDFSPVQILDMGPNYDGNPIPAN
jgi:hypothetical protein